MTFNMIDEKWIPTTEGLKSLTDIFTDREIRGLAGRPDQQISVLRLLLGITQASVSWTTEAGWVAGRDTYPAEVLKYLAKWHDRFDLFSTVYPFLQDVSLPRGEYSTSYFDIAKMNGTQVQSFASMKAGEDVSLARLALDILSYQNFSPQVAGSKGRKWNEGDSGVALGRRGYLHSFISSDTVLGMLHSNILLEGELLGFKNGLGVPVWETGVADPDTYLGSMVPQSRGLLLTGSKLFSMSRGVSYAGVELPSTTVLKRKSEGVTFLMTDPTKRVWRELTSLLSFLDGSLKGGCPQIRLTEERVRRLTGELGISCMGVRVNKDAFSQFFTDDSGGVNSRVIFPGSVFGEDWHTKLEKDMGLMGDVGSLYSGVVYGYWKSFKADKKACAGYSNRARQLWWEAMEALAGPMIASPGGLVREVLIGKAKGLLKELCPCNTPRGMKSYVKAESKLK